MVSVPMSAPSWRYVTDAEQALAREVFGQGLRPARVRVFCEWPVTDPFTPGSWGVVFPPGRAYEDFTVAPPRRRADFVHELVHVWQAQNGVNLLIGKLIAGNNYDYDDDLPGAPGHHPPRDGDFPLDRFPKLNIEQQAAFIEHAFLAERDEGGDHPAAYYAPSRPHLYRP
ncbi:MAG TPA: hypothetical protein VF495_08265 [Phenylobacterium sp.]